MNHITIASFYRATPRPPRSLHPRSSTARLCVTARKRVHYLPKRSSSFNARHRPSHFLLSRCSLRTTSSSTYCTNDNNISSSTLLAANSNNTKDAPRWISHSIPRQNTAEQQQQQQQHSAPSENNSRDAISTTTSINHQPPLPVRIALVSTTTALATPSFPALGFLYVVLRYTIPDANLRKTMEGQWGTLLSFTTWTLLPQLYGGTVASLILPCAIGNAIVAGGVYGLVDVACGGPSSSSSSSSDTAINKAFQNPLITGSGIGATVGYVAPHYAYGPVLEHLYGLEGASRAMHSAMSFPGVMSASVATGAIAGMILHPLLYYPMHGLAGIHWGYFSGTALAAVSAALVYVYYGREDTGLPVPCGSFIEPSDMKIVDSVLRYNRVSGEVETYSLDGGEFLGSSDRCLVGRNIASASRSYARSGKVVFDDRLLAFVYNFWDQNAKSRHPEHILNIKSKKELQKRQDLMALTDVSIAAILHDEKCGTYQHDDSASAANRSSDDELMKIVTTINKLSSSNRGRKQLSFKNLEEVSVAIQLLMILNQSKQDHPATDALSIALEKFIRKRCPEITLFTSEELNDGESVESQLRIANWKGPEPSHAMHRWKHIYGNEVHRTWKNRALVVATGVILTVAGSILRGNK